MEGIKTRAQIFFILMIILFLIIIAVAVIFGGVLANETISQKSKTAAIKTDALTLSAINYAVYQLNKDKNFITPTTTMTLTQGNVDYSIQKISATTRIVGIRAVSGKVIKSSQAQILFNETETDIISVNFNY